MYLTTLLSLTGIAAVFLWAAASRGDGALMAPSSAAFIVAGALLLLSNTLLLHTGTDINTQTQNISVDRSFTNTTQQQTYTDIAADYSVISLINLLGIIYIAAGLYTGFMAGISIYYR